MNLGLETKTIDGIKVDFFKLSQRNFSKLKRKMVATMSRMDDSQSNSLVIISLIDTEFYDLLQEITYPIIKVDGKDISNDANFEAVMESAGDTFEIKLYHEILNVYLGKFLMTLTTEGNGSETTAESQEVEKKEIEIRQIGKTGSSGSQ